MHDLKTTEIASLCDKLYQLGITQHTDQLLQYVLLLQKWNSAYNLIAECTLPTILTRHIADSLAITPYVHGSHILDVGSGAGLPGLPLAITMPHITVELIDSNGKKTRFLETVKRNLNLKNVIITQARVEHYHPTYYFDTVICRAFSSLKKLASGTQHWD